MQGKNNKFILICFALVSIMLASAFGVYSFIQATHSESLPVISKIDHFTLIDSNDKGFDSGTLRGKVWVANLFYTNCSDIYLGSIKNMASLSRTFEQISGVKLLSISVNPENDSPAVLKYFQSTLNYGKGNWYFLTGTKQQVRDLSLNQFKLGNLKTSELHSTQLSLVDRTGYIRGYYDGTKTEEINQLFKDINRLLKERF